ncbi:GH92 family glycosyl hydrolase [Listeria sp. ILCC810]|uniref:GH92 family glycosyl hydrolase n=1 Tax=Listeria sp. ILCC810 TaxID=1918336 RepID=UPI000B595457|nr:GH92 family glycosyl hydrolase [Listeria sp. ILCC810]
MDVTQIDTRHGTNNQHSYSNGNTLPYTSVPRGMNYFVPQTTNNNGSWFFHPNDHTFQGFRLTHQPSPWMGDFSHFLLTPISGKLANYDLYFAQSSYRPNEAVFSPHYLKIKQLRYQITSELTPSTYGAKIRLSYTKDEQHGLLFSAENISYIEVDERQNRVFGYVQNFAGCADPEFKMHFVLTADRPFDFSNTSFPVDGKIISKATQKAENQFFQIGFDDTAPKTVEISLATSFISPEQASLNLKRQADYDFEATKTRAAAKWNAYLSKIQVSDSDKAKVATFYHCLYRTALFPQRFYEYDANQNAIHYDTTARRVANGRLYTNNGFWDTYKTVFPLYSLLIPDEYEKMLGGFLNSYRETGYLPKWLSPDERGLMPGTLIDAVIADAAVKGIGTNLMPEFQDAMLKAATTQSDKENYGRRGALDYNRLGYVPLNYHESVNHTLDYAYSDFCISAVAKTLGNTALEAEYEERSKNYLHIFDPKTGFMRAKDENGNFQTPFNPFSWGKDYAEGSAWQNSFAVFHDFAGLNEAYGEGGFLRKLTELANTPPKFDVDGYGYEIHEMSEMAMIDFGQIALSNQPSFHLPYLFTYAKKPAYTQVLIKQAVNQFYDAGINGYPGDEDNGSMSGWYIFSTLGFYPVTPGSGEYVFGIPAFENVRIDLPNGKTLTLDTANNSPAHQFVTARTRDNKPLKSQFITHSDLIRGGNLTTTLGLVPEEREISEEELPFSISSAQKSILKFQELATTHSETC